MKQENLEKVINDRQIYEDLKIKLGRIDQVIIAQWLAWQLATGEVPGLNPGKGDNDLF